MPTVRIGNACGFWGDNLDAPIALAQQGNLGYLTLEYLAELTMSMLALQKQKDPQAGCAADFLDVLGRLGPVLAAQPNLKIITNAGGMNPRACGQRALEMLGKIGLQRRIGVVEGDDLLGRLANTPQVRSTSPAGLGLANLDTGEALEKIHDRIVSANAYLGARPIAEALGMGADIVITGRVADASLTVGPAVHEFGWDWHDWDRLGTATVAGHLIECGAQATGGLWCNWNEAGELGNVGYPFVDMNDDGSFTLSKPAGTGGAVNIETVAEQLLYEVADPARYLTPDVVADFTSIRLTQQGPDVVHVGACASRPRGQPATDTYKVSIAYRHGFSASGTLVIMGPQARAKALACGKMIFQRLERAGFAFEQKNIEALGTGACAPGVLRKDADPPEVVLRVTVHDARKDAVERFTKELAPLVTSGPPGVTGYTTGRPPVREVFAYWPALVSKDLVTAQVSMLS